MAIAELDNLVQINKLKAEAGTQSEFNGLVRSGLARLKDVKRTSGLSPESCFDLAYNAAHALSLAALRWHGTVQRIVILYSSAFPILSSCLLISGVYWIKHIKSGIWPNMKAMLTLKSRCLSH